MNLQDAEDLARKLMNEWLPSYWTFSWNERRTTFGLCSFQRAEIQLSAPVCQLNSREDVEDTIRHEIAHAMAGPEAGHGPEWKRMAVILGAKPRARADFEAPPPPPAKWQATCPECGQSHEIRRLTNRVRSQYEAGQRACTPCCRKHNGGKFDKRFAMTLKQMKGRPEAPAKSGYKWHVVCPEHGVILRRDRLSRDVQEGIRQGRYGCSQCNGRPVKLQQMH